MGWTVHFTGKMGWTVQLTGKMGWNVEFTGGSLRLRAATGTEFQQTLSRALHPETVPERGYKQWIVHKKALVTKQWGCLQIGTQAEFHLF